MIFKKGFSRFCSFWRINLQFFDGPYFGKLIKQIVLSDGQVAFVDDEDFVRVNEYTWHSLLGSSGITYAITNIRIDGQRTTISLHRFIMNAKPGEDIDHEDRNGLNNVKFNLRPATRTQNNANGVSRGGSSIYKGVTWDKSRQKWLASIQVDKKRTNLGRYDCEESAARAYDAAAVKYFGEFARLNFPT